MKKLTTQPRLNRREARKILAEKDAALKQAEQLVRAKDAVIGLKSQSVESATRACLDYRDKFRAIASMVARHSILAGEPTTLLNGAAWNPKQHGDRIETYSIEPLQSFIVDNLPMNETSFTSEIMRLMTVEMVADRMRGVTHARVELADRVVGYAISEKALRNMSHRELVVFLREEVATAITERLVGELKKSYK